MWTFHLIEAGHVKVERRNAIYPCWGLAGSPTAHDPTLGTIDQTVMLIIGVRLWKQLGSINKGNWCYRGRLRLKDEKRDFGD
ncbi:hypothetical protein PSE10B_50490 [Pseudomonas amygdali pv. eriobotryae]|nr:hypothetical protein PSE10B_50490 [Pseudomonas amygdali pv. eriobotryae]